MIYSPLDFDGNQKHGGSCSWILKESLKDLGPKSKSTGVLIVFFVFDLWLFFLNQGMPQTRNPNKKVRTLFLFFLESRKIKTRKENKNKKRIKTRLSLPPFFDSVALCASHRVVVGALRSNYTSTPHRGSACSQTALRALFRAIWDLFSRNSVEHLRDLRDIP